MTVQWDNDSPIYLQLYRQVIGRILDRHLKEGEALPSVRAVAAQYQINPVTISKAYQMLQDEKLVEKQRGKGLFIKLGVRELVMEREKQRFLIQEWPLVLEQIKRLELSPDELLAKESVANKSANTEISQEEQA